MRRGAVAVSGRVDPCGESDLRGGGRSESHNVIDAVKLRCITKPASGHKGRAAHGAVPIVARCVGRGRAAGLVESPIGLQSVGERGIGVDDHRDFDVGRQLAVARS